MHVCLYAYTQSLHKGMADSQLTKGMNCDWRLEGKDLPPPFSFARMHWKQNIPKFEHMKHGFIWLHRVSMTPFEAPVHQQPAAESLETKAS